MSDIDVSFILTGRDDGYAGDFMSRFEIALMKNLQILKNSNLKYEIIVVDYNPFEGKRLIDSPKISDLLSEKCVRNIIIDKSVLIDQGLPENAFFEYYGKNVGAMKSMGKLLFMTNADIFISKEIVDYLKYLSVTYSNENFYRIRYRQDYANGKMFETHIDLHSPDDPDEPICGGYSGDATIFPKDVFMNIANGYDEKDPNHKNAIGQACMDGEILWQLVRNGVSKVLVDLTYYHVRHDRQPKHISYRKDGYTNKEDWGCINYPSRVINKNTIEIYK